MTSNKAMENWEELKYVRLCVIHPLGSDPKIVRRMKINGAIYQITLEEELALVV